MKITLHLVWNDIRRLRWWVALLALTLVATDVLGFALLYTGVPASRKFSDDTWLRITALRNTFVGLELLFSYILVLLLVHGDSLHGTRAFWLTRPVSWRRLLASKLLGGALLVIVLPIAVRLPWWLWCGFGPAALTEAMLKTAAITGLIAIPAAFVGAMCDTLSRAVVWGCVIVPVVVLGVGGTLMAAGINPLGMSDFSALLIMMAVLTLVSFGAATVVQFATRNGILAAVALGVGIVLTSAVPSQWRRISWVAEAEPAASTSDAAKDVALELVDARRTGGSGRKGEDMPLVLDLRHTGELPAGTYIDFNRSSHVWRFDGGLEVRRNPTGTEFWSAAYQRMNALGFKGPSEDPETREWVAARQAQSEERLRSRGISAGRQRRSFEYSAAVMLPPSILARIENEKPSYDGTYRLQLMRARIVEEIDTGSHAWSARDAHGVRIVGSKTYPDSIDLFLVDTHPGFVTSAPTRSRLFGLFLHGFSMGEERSFLLVKHAENEAVVPNVSTRRSLALGGVILTWREVSARENVIRGGELTAPEKPWFVGARLAIVTGEEVAEFRRTIQVPKFEIGHW